MQKTQRQKHSDIRKLHRKLRNSFRASMNASLMGEEVNLKSLSSELCELRSPENASEGRSYVKSLLAAGQAHYQQGADGQALKLWDTAVEVCRQYEMTHQELKTLRRIIRVLRSQQRLSEALDYLEDAMTTSSGFRLLTQHRQFRIEKAMVQALLAYEEQQLAQSGKIFLQEEEPNLDRMRTRRLPAAEAVGARGRARMRRTVFDGLDILASLDPRRNGGRRRAVFNTTMLRKQIGAWTRSPRESG